jgi:hypothetical protein
MRQLLPSQDNQLFNWPALKRQNEYQEQATQQVTNSAKRQSEQSCPPCTKINNAMADADKNIENQAEMKKRPTG